MAAAGGLRWSVTRWRSDRLPTLLLMLAVMVLPTVVFTAVVLPMTPGRLALPSAHLIDRVVLWSWLMSLPWPVPTGWALAISLAVVTFVAFGAYAAAVTLCWDRAADRKSLAAVLVPTVVFLAISAAALPTQSSDMIDYLLSGRVSSEHGASPYTIPPDAFPDDPLLPYASGTYTVDGELKPPVWIGTAVGMARIAGDEPGRAVLTVRLVFLAVNLVNLCLIAAVLGRQAGKLLSGLALYGWSPILALHGQAKFDPLMATFALLAALLLVTARNRWVGPALWMSVMVKVLTLPLLVAFLLSEAIARRWRRLADGVAIIMALTVIGYIPFGGRPSMVVDHIGLVEQGGSSMPFGLGLVIAAAISVTVVWAGFTARESADRQIRGWALIAIGVMVLTPVSFSWYLIAPLAIVSVAGQRWPTVVAVIVSAAKFFVDVWVRSSKPLNGLPDAGLTRHVVFLTVLGVAALGAMGMWHRRAHTRSSSRTDGISSTSE